MSHAYSGYSHCSPLLVQLQCCSTQQLRLDENRGCKGLAQVTASSEPALRRELAEVPAWVGDDGAATNAAPDWSDAVACDTSLVQDGGVENASGLAERAERNPGDAQESLDSLQLTELLESAEAGDDAVEAVDQQEANILTVLVQLC